MFFHVAEVLGELYASAAGDSSLCFKFDRSEKYLNCVWSTQITNYDWLIRNTFTKCHNLTWNLFSDLLCLINIKLICIFGSRA